MSTRANQAFVSRRAKQRLVEVLFGQRNARGRGGGPPGGPHAHRRLDPHSYTYKQLRRAYLKRLQDIHPDKFAHRSSVFPAGDASTDDVRGESRGPPGADESSSSSSRERHDAFVEVQDAWDEYEKLARAMQKASGGGGASAVGVDGADANFTMFGVGCSFSDSPEERDLRSEIMDQAGRGFFYSGLIEEKCRNAEKGPGREDHGGSAERVRLSDDDLFMTQHEDEDKTVRGSTDCTQERKNERGHSSDASSLKPNRKSLVPGGLPRKTGAQSIRSWFKLDVLRL